jgi:hypothetical protein
MSIVPRIKYLNNRELLSAIHESKNTFCEYDDPQYSSFDIIVHDINTVSDDVILAARQKRLTAMIAEEKKANKSKTFESLLTLNDVPSESIVVRVMTFDHVPLNTNKIDKAKTIAERHIKCNFPPFQHFVQRNQEWHCVGKSHWKNGQFSLHHGKVTNRLAAMWMKLVERYGHRGNWRGYTYVDEMKAQALVQLAQVGLQFDESKSSNPFSYYTQVASTSFLKILNLEKRSQIIRDDLLIMNNQMPSHTRTVEDQLAQRADMDGASDTPAPSEDGESPTTS